MTILKLYTQKQKTMYVLFAMNMVNFGKHQTSIYMVVDAQDVHVPTQTYPKKNLYKKQEKFMETNMTIR